MTVRADKRQKLKSPAKPGFCAFQGCSPAGEA